MALWLSLIANSSPVSAADEDGLGVLSVTFENDIFADADQHYTNGVRLAWLSPLNAVPKWVRRGARYIPFFPDDARARVEFSLGQNMYTPRDITVDNPPDEDRPYGGWLYGGVGLVAENGKRLDQLELSLGVVGSWSLAGDTQRLIHEWIDADEPRGWDSQLPNEAAIQLSYRRAERAYQSGEFLGFAYNVTPNVGLAVGNVLIYAETGAMLRAGQFLPDDYGPARINPSVPGSGFFRPQSNLGWYIFGAVEGRAVARNLFLDGSTFANSRSVDKYLFVADFEAGLVLQVWGARFSYTQVWRTKEFDTQERADGFGVLSASFRW